MTHSQTNPHVCWWVLLIDPSDPPLTLVFRISSRSYGLAEEYTQFPYQACSCPWILHLPGSTVVYLHMVRTLFQHLPVGATGWASPPDRLPFLVLMVTHSVQFLWLSWSFDEILLILQSKHWSSRWLITCWDYSQWVAEHGLEYWAVSAPLLSLCPAAVQWTLTFPQLWRLFPGQSEALKMALSV